MRNRLCLCGPCVYMCVYGRRLAQGRLLSQWTRPEASQAYTKLKMGESALLCDGDLVHSRVVTVPPAGRLPQDTGAVDTGEKPCWPAWHSNLLTLTAPKSPV